MNDQTDPQLLSAYSENRSEAAFSELVRRHVDFVYSAARRMVCDQHLAQDVTQGVFVALAKSASQLKDRAVISGWLHRTAQNIAAQTVRTIERRRAREKEATAMNELLAGETDSAWENIVPHLDAALGELSEPDRDALLLRYFERKSAREMAQTLNVSEEAAQKRVNRAVERLRELFSRRNVTIGTNGLPVLISSNAVQAAPIGLPAVISSAVSLVGTTVQTSVATATQSIAMTTLQKTLITVALAATIGAGIYEARQASNLRTQVHMLQEQRSTENQQLQTERADATHQIAALQEDIERLRRNTSEVHKLRADMAALRKESEGRPEPTSVTAIQGAAAPPVKRSLSVADARAIFTPATFKDAGLDTPQKTIETYLWTMREAADAKSNQAATEKLREISWFPPGFDSQKFRYAEYFTNTFSETRFMKVDSIIYASPETAEVIVGAYRDDGNWQGTTYSLIHEDGLWKVIAPVQP